MYKRSFSPNRFASSRFSKPRPRFGGGGRPRNGGQFIDESKFIRKGATQEQVDSFVPKFSFNDLKISKILKNNILKKGYSNPTPIQDAAIPHVLEGKDVVGIANTGTGKTAAFLVPLIEKVSKNRQEQILIIGPTRELALQIRDELRSLTQGINAYAAVCTGGSPIRAQSYELSRNPQFIIGTPGRLKDMIERRQIHMDRINTIVLDEVDRMLDMGFVHEIKALIAMLPQKRQSLFFSATVSPTIQQLINTFAKDPVIVSVKTRDTTANVDQDVVRVQGGAVKMEVLEELLKKEDFKKVLIFGKTKHGVERLSISLFKKGFKVASIHGDKAQSQRNHAIRLFKENVVKILVATDVASRGIDIDDISHVINFDQPNTYEDYIHRIGRTGRGNKRGVALTFVER